MARVDVVVRLLVAGGVQDGAVLTARREITGLLAGYSVVLVLTYVIANPADSRRAFRIVTAIARELPEPASSVVTAEAVSAIVTFGLVAACVRLAGAVVPSRRWSLTMVAGCCSILLAATGWAVARSSTDELLAALAATVSGCVAGSLRTYSESSITASSLDVQSRWKRRLRRFQRAVFLTSASLTLIAIVGAPLYAFPDTGRTMIRPDVVVVLGPASAERIAHGIDVAERARSSTVAVSSSLRPDGSFASPQCSEAGAAHVICFVADPFSTAGEMKAIETLGNDLGWKRVLILTATPHVMRATYIADRCLTARAAVRAVDGPDSITDWALAYLYQSFAFAKIALSGACA